MNGGVFSLLGTVLLAAAIAQAPVERRKPPSQAAQSPANQSQAENSGQVPVIHVQSRLVDVAVNVEDAAGAPVGGLTREDFEILEDNLPQTIAFFERDSSTPLSIVLAIDTSGSVMREENLEKNAAKHFVKALLRSQDELDLLEFADHVREVVPFTNDPKKIDAGLGELRRGDATAVFNAIYLAAQQLAATRADDGRRRVMVMITDGGDTVNGVRYGQALEQAQRAAAMVYSIIVVPVLADAGRNEGGEHALIQMAADTGGKYYYAEDPKQLEPAFAKISDDLRTQYVLGYYAPEQTAREADAHPGGYRAIAVRMKDPALRQKYKLRYRTGYYGTTR